MRPGPSLRHTVDVGATGDRPPDRRSIVRLEGGKEGLGRRVRLRPLALDTTRLEHNEAESDYVFGLEAPRVALPLEAFLVPTEPEKRRESILGDEELVGEGDLVLDS